jgi:methylmalonyl-CoA mutase
MSWIKLIKIFVIPPNRIRYLAEISENNRAYDKWVKEQKEIAQKLYALQKSLSILSNSSKDIIAQIKTEYKTLILELDPKNKILIVKFRLSNICHHISTSTYIL